MSAPPEILVDVLKYIALALAVLSTLSSAVLTLAGKRRQSVVVVNEREKVRDYAREIRLPEVKQLLSEEEGRKGLYRAASASLAFGQFVVGGLLASSFIAENLSKSLIGFLGLLVLAASLVNQHFRPDILHKATAFRVYRLRSLRRWIEDQLYEFSRTETNDESIAAIRRKVSEALDELDRGELAFEKNDKA
ncbi:MAG: hypothetical protein H7A44_05980 [Opitutaceae bacterium]|nr:hypothetical protein [Cephaloticoccus sp.]MCP5529972.1 hypothetical protein [Opitutaceae bacterium]